MDSVQPDRKKAVAVTNAMFGGMQYARSTVAAPAARAMGMGRMSVK